MDFVGFMFFSLIEGLAVFALILYLFRFDLLKYFWHVFFVVNLIDLQNYFIREELSWSAVAPVMNIVIIVFFLSVFIQIPIIWSMVMTLTGYFGFMIIQSLLVFLSFGYFPSGYDVVWKAYLVQLITGMIGFFLSWLLYKMGYGFSFSFERLRLRRERMIMSLAVAVFLVILTIFILYKNMFINLIIFAIMLFLLLIFSFRKELDSP